MRGKHYRSQAPGDQTQNPLLKGANDLPLGQPESDLVIHLTDINSGITATATGFYGPQGRILRLSPFIADLHDKMGSFNYNGNRITNFEMETSALYYLGQTLGHNTLTICAIIGNRLTKEYSKDYKKTVEHMIDLVLNQIC